jgi:hypothetical protein
LCKVPIHSLSISWSLSWRSFLNIFWSCNIFKTDCTW